MKGLPQENNQQDCDTRVCDQVGVIQSLSGEWYCKECYEIRSNIIKDISNRLNEKGRT